MTGMPGELSRALTIAGAAYGLMLLAATFLKGTREAKQLGTFEALLAVGLLLGCVIFLGVVSGAYRLCPACCLVWGAVGFSVMGYISTGRSGSKYILALMLAITCAIGWTRFDRTTASSVFQLLPRVDLSADCVADVLRSSDYEALEKLGAPQNGAVVVVAHCSPCAAASVIRAAKRSPGIFIVAPDSQLATSLPNKRLIVYPALRQRCIKLQSNLYEVKFNHKQATECKTFIEHF